MDTYNYKAYVPKADQNATCGQGSVQNIRVLRFAEILLINAEAANELGNTGAAQASLNKVRNRAKLGDTTASSQAGLRTAIWHERRVELAMEGDRFVDLVRTGQAATVLAPYGFKAGKNELFPIPFNAITQSQNVLTQNPELLMMFKNILIFTLAIAGVTCSSQSPVRENKKSDAKKLTDDQLLDKVQRQTFRYFWDFAEPHSGMARERYHPDGNYPDRDANIVTTGGSGFGLMSIISAANRGYIKRKEALERLNKIADFLTKADRFHGAWSHWIDGETGKVKPFGTKDNGGDLVETSFLAQGFLVVREYFKNGTAEEKVLAEKYDKLWKGIEWNWYTKGGEDVLYWHWSPNYAWDMNFKLEGYNECLITYVMAASSPTHTISREAYDKGWARNGKIISDKVAYGFPLILKHNGAENYGGPLFWAHYSYLGLDLTG